MTRLPAPPTPPTPVAPGPPSRWWPSLLGVVAITAWPFVALVAANLDQQVDGSAIARWWLGTLAVAGGSVLLASRRSAEAARTTAVIVSVLTWLAYNFTSVSALLVSLGWGVSPAAWWATLATLVLAGTLAVARRAPVQQVVLIVSILFATAAGAQLAAAAAAAPSPDETDGSPVESDPGVLPTSSFANNPDVWLIVLDGLVSDGWLAGRTGHDASAFEASLEAKGFRIQPDASSNYPLTHLSMASTLAMEYRYEGDVPPGDGLPEPGAAPFFASIQGDNAFVDLLLSNGYRYVHASPGFWRGSRCGGREDICIDTDGLVNETQVALRAMVPWGQWATGGERHRQIADANDASQVVATALDATEEAGINRPTFHLVHMLNPHPPLLRDAACGLRDDIPLSLALWGDGPEYADAVTCLQSQLDAAATAILADDPDALIVIQGDHGARLGIDWNTPDGVLLGEEMHFSIFSAFHLPTACAGMDVPADLTSVNTLRIVRACLEGTEPSLLEDRRFPIRAHRG